MSPALLKISRGVCQQCLDNQTKTYILTVGIVQGVTIELGFLRGNVRFSERFRITFEREKGGDLGPYCKAYMREPQDRSVRDKDKEVTLHGVLVKLANCVFQRIQNTTPAKFVHASAVGLGGDLGISITLSQNRHVRHSLDGAYYLNAFYVVAVFL